MDSTIALGIDIGSTNIKAVLVDVASLEVLSEAAQPTPQDGARLITDVEALVGPLLASGRRPPVCVGIASMAESGVPLGADNRPLGAILRWDRRRDTAPLTALSGRMPPRELFAATGVRLSGKVPLAIWAGLRVERPDLFAEMQRWAGVADLVGLAMTGELVTDHTLAARTGAYRLPDTALSSRFDAELLALSGLATEQLPEIRRPGERWPVTVAEGFAGIPGGTPVVIAGHDHAVGGYLAGARAPGDVLDSLGTAEAILVPLPSRPGAARVEEIFDAGFGLVPTLPGDGLALLGGSPGAGAMVAWWRNEMLGGTDAEAVFARAGELLPAASGFTILPYPRGRQCPLPDPDATTAVLPRRPATTDEFVAATLGLFEGLAFQARWMTDTALALAGIAPSRVIAIGGPAEDVPWFALKAALLPVPLHRATIDRAVAVGAAVVAAERSGLLNGPPPAAQTRVVAPTPRDYEARFRDFVALATERTDDRKKESTTP